MEQGINNELEETHAPMLNDNEQTPILINHESDAKAEAKRIGKQDIYDMMLADAKMCHFIGDILSGSSPNDAAKTHLIEPQVAQIIEDDKIAGILSEIDSSIIFTKEVGEDIQKLRAGFNTNEMEDEMLKVLCRGWHYEQMISEAEQRGYVKGRNENIEIKKKGGEDFMPNLMETKRHNYENKDISILKNPRKSIWDI